MENKINLVEILKNCPKGMELDCPLLDNMEFEELDFNFHNYPIVIRNSKTNAEIYLTEYGQFMNEENYKCIIFPKGKNTWEGFVPPCKFKDGDIVATSKGDYVFILKKVISYRSNNICDGTCYCAFGLGSKKLLTKETNWYFSRLATEEEKAELFKAIKENGYKWNAEKKALEELIEPKFKMEEDGVYAYNEINCYHQDFGDKVRIRLGGDYEVKVEDNITYIVKKQPQYPKTYEECCEVKEKIIFEYGAMSSRFRLQAENKFTAYAAMVLHFYSNPHLVALYEPEDLAKQDSWLMHTPVEPRLDEIFGGKGSFMKYLREHEEEIKEAIQNVEKII